MARRRVSQNCRRDCSLQRSTIVVCLVVFSFAALARVIHRYSPRPLVIVQVAPRFATGALEQPTQLSITLDAAESPDGSIYNLTHGRSSRNRRRLLHEPLARLIPQRAHKLLLVRVREP